MCYISELYSFYKCTSARYGICSRCTYASYDVCTSVCMRVTRFLQMQIGELKSFYMCTYASSGIATSVRRRLGDLFTCNFSS